MRGGSSARLYQQLIRTNTAGRNGAIERLPVSNRSRQQASAYISHEPSTSPSKNRTAASCEKFLVKPWLIDRMPQSAVVMQM